MLQVMMERRGQRARRLGQMLDRMDVDVVELARSRHGLDFAKAGAACAACAHAETCERAHVGWLAGREDIPAPADFCPNAEMFSRFREHG